ncbi:MAG: hypothetical protein LBU91_04670, partial [Bacteroidales bacterium]|jgi:hypothetical protein|nr:hypothetical protein [Bacteroidales bacterium]
LKTKEKIKDKLTYLDHTYGRESFRSFFADTIQNEESIYKIFDKLDIDNGKKDVEDFSIYKSFNNSVHALNNDFNTLIVVAYRDYNKNTSEKINYAYKKGEFLINVVSENRVFSIPLKKIVKEYFEIPDNEKKMEYILCSDDYTFVIVSFYGSYEKETDVISINGLEGYLFYNRIK